MEKLKFKEFHRKEELVEWANSKTGTDYIISICQEIRQMEFWIIWYIG